MPDKTHEPVNLSGPSIVPLPTKSDPIDDEEEFAKQELKRISPSNEELLRIAAKCGPLPKWLDEDEAPPF